jgi:hypothetical protein
VIASGTFASGTLDVAASQGFGNFVIDFGAVQPENDDAPLY